MRTAVLDIGGTSIKAGLAENGCLQAFREEKTLAGRGGQAVLQTAGEILRDFSGFGRIGISTAGQVNPETGCIVYANENLPAYTGCNVKKFFEDRFGVPTAVENDVNAAAIGEAAFGAGQGFSDFLCLTYGTGIGGAIVLNGSVYRGATCSAGEFGHLVTHAGGKTCGCGQKGCYEQYASVTALVREAVRIDPALNSGREIFRRRDDPRVQALLDQWYEEIAVGIASLIHSFNPACVILGGGVMEEPAVPDAIGTLLSSLLMPSYRGTPVRRAALGNRAGLLGASLLAERL